MKNINIIKNKFRAVPDYPIEGVTFQDITPVLADAYTKKITIDELISEAMTIEYDYVMGIEARGFIFASIIADFAGHGLILVRKPGKLPPPVNSVSYKTEYSKTSLELSLDIFPPKSKILIVDDILATGGSLKAAAKLVKKAGGIVTGFLVIGEIPGLNGRKEIEQYAKLHSLFTF